MITPGASGPPDTGRGFPYPLMIGSPASSGVTVSGRSLVRMGDRIPTPPGLLLVLGPPAAPFIVDQFPP
jgi:hypothetical protein